MLSIARRPDRHYGFDGWMTELTEIPLVAIPATSNVDIPWEGQYYPTGNAYAQFANSQFDTSELYPNNIFFGF